MLIDIFFKRIILGLEYSRQRHGMQTERRMMWVSIGLLTVLLGLMRSDRDVQAANLEPLQVKIPVARQSLIGPQND
ncbi:MAG TPA: hypothetical protein V6D19_14450, partial [Stenomitos sp.]